MPPFEWDPDHPMDHWGEDRHGWFTMVDLYHEAQKALVLWFLTMPKEQRDRLVKEGLSNEEVELLNTAVKFIERALP